MLQYCTEKRSSLNFHFGENRIDCNKTKGIVTYA